MTVVLITGALTGIGRATALAFAKEGDQIVVSGRHGDTGAELVAELRSLGAEAEFFCADVRHDEEMRSLIDQTVKRFGRLDVAVNNAGTEGHPGPVTEQTPKSYAAVFDTNVLGTLLGMKHEMRVMAPQGGGSIVNLSSVLGKVGAPGAAGGVRRDPGPDRPAPRCRRPEPSGSRHPVGVVGGRLYGPVADPDGPATGGQ